MSARPGLIAGQVVAVHGGAAPLADAIAAAAARAGARVALLGRDEARLGAAIRAINNGGGIADYAVVPGEGVAAIGAAGRAARARFGRLDAWVEIGADLPAGCAAAAALLPPGGVLVVVASPGEDSAMLRERIARLAPAATLALVRPAGEPGEEALAAAVVRALARPRALTVVTGGARRAAVRPAVAAAVGLGTVAATAGLVAWLRRRRDRA